MKGCTVLCSKRTCEDRNSHAAIEIDVQVHGVRLHRHDDDADAAEERADAFVINIHCKVVSEERADAFVINIHCKVVRARFTLAGGWLVVKGGVSN